MTNFYDVIDSKVIDYGEVIVCLFENCNMTCSFCPQDHDSLVGVSRDKIIGKIPRIVDWINSNKRSTYFKLHIMGGEVFQDSLIQQGYLDIYQKMMDTIRAQVDPSKHLVFNFVTNLVFDETQKVMDFIASNNLMISTSYDSRGRFNRSQLEVFKRNVEIFKQRIEMVALVLTRQNIEAIINGDEYFDYIYQNFTCDFDSFLPSVAPSSTMMPKESDLLRFNKYLIDNYPDCLNVEYFTSPEQNRKMACTRGNNYTILHDDSEPQGCSGTVLLKDKTTKNLASEEIVINFFKKYNCFQCPYYSKCPFTCFIKNDYNKMERDVGDCVFKLTFEYVDEKSNNPVQQTSKTHEETDNRFH